MLVEINLLPRKEPRKYGFAAVMAVLAGLFLIAAVYYIWQVKSTNTNLKAVNKELAVSEKIIENRSKQAAKKNNSNSIDNLKKAIGWVQSSKILTVPVLDEFTSLLPERGFILSYQSETTANTVQLKVQFDTGREAAYYLSRLNQSEIVKKASISSLTVSGSVSSPTSASSTESGIISNQAQTGNAGSSAQSLQSNNESNAGGKNDATDTLSAHSSLSDNQDLPRYTGKFTIILNLNEIKKMEHEHPATEGAAGS